jgi:hypothetical protein
VEAVPLVEQHALRALEHHRSLAQQPGQVPGPGQPHPLRERAARRGDVRRRRRAERSELGLEPIPQPR